MLAFEKHILCAIQGVFCALPRQTWNYIQIALIQWGLNWVPNCRCPPFRLFSWRVISFSSLHVWEWECAKGIFLLLEVRYWLTLHKFSLFNKKHSLQFILLYRQAAFFRTPNNAILVLLRSTGLCHNTNNGRNVVYSGVLKCIVNNKTFMFIDSQKFNNIALDLQYILYLL